MRKIERAMVDALLSDKNMMKDNTEVKQLDGSAYVYLHGNLIAQYDKYGLMVTLAGWNSPTTRSRLSAIISGVAANGSKAPNGLGVGSRNGQPYLYDARGASKIDEDGWHPVVLPTDETNK